MIKKKEKKKRKEIIIWHGKGTQEEVNARVKAIESGKELLPDGSDYSKKPNDYHVEIQFWDNIFRDQPFEIDQLFKDEYFFGPKRWLDTKFRSDKEGDRYLPLAHEKDMTPIKWDLAGGLNSLDLTFNKTRIFQAIQRGYSEAMLPDGRYPGKVSVNYPQIYKLLGIDPIVKSDGRKGYPEGKRGQLRKWLKEELRELDGKSYAFIGKEKTGEDEKGKPLYHVMRVFAPLIKVVEHYKDIRQRELPGLENPGTKFDKRFSHFDIYINHHVRYEAHGTFRYLPSALGKEISDYRKPRGERPSAQDINFIDWLYWKYEPQLEINYLKLARKLKIKFGRDHKRLREHLDRIYEMALALKFLLKVEKDMPGLRATKEIFYLNPERFKYLKGKK